MQDIQNHQLGETNEVLVLETFNEHRAVALSLARQAVRSLHIFTHNLDPAVFDTAEFTEAASRLARSSPYANIKILVQNSSLAVRNGHRLVHLSQRLSSKIEIRNPIEEYADIRRSFFVADEAGYISRQLAEQYHGVANFSDRLEARNLIKFFDEVWERSSRDPQLVRMHL